MRLWGCIPLTLLALVALSTTTQVAWNSDATTQSQTVVDVLNNDEDYSSLLSLLQKAKLIPTLNKLNDSTLFAPTNDAIKRHDLWRSALEYPNSLKDNLQEELRQQLFYHLLNYSVTEDPNLTTLRVLETLHFPKFLDPPTNKPPPWMPIPESTLGNQSQKLRLTSRDGVSWVGVDAFGKGGIEVKKQKVEAANGVVYGIADVLEVPPHLGWFLLIVYITLSHPPTQVAYCLMNRRCHISRRSSHLAYSMSSTLPLSLRCSCLLILHGKHSIQLSGYTSKVNLRRMISCAYSTCILLSRRASDGRTLSAQQLPVSGHAYTC
jgi:uncharacterized surface protein with fasciclin (FAS1) repeats